MRLLSTIALWFVFTGASMASVFTTTNLYDYSGGTSTCSPAGSVTVCTYNNWWSNGTLTTTNSATAGTDPGGRTWLTVSANDNYNYNWGENSGSSWFTENQGVSFGTAD